LGKGSSREEGDLKKEKGMQKEASVDVVRFKRTFRKGNLEKEDGGGREEKG